MGEVAVQRRRTGGRSARVREAVLKATLQVVAEQGADAINIGEIARRSKVHETSIYRRWPTKEHLILEALLDYSEEKLPIPDTGTLRDDLVAFATAVANYLASPLGRTVAKSMAVADDDATLASTRTQFWQSRFDLARVIVDRAASRGELPDDTDPAMALELLIAPLHFRALLTRQPVDEQLAGQVVDLLLKGIASRTAEPRRHPLGIHGDADTKS